MSEQNQTPNSYNPVISPAIAVHAGMLDLLMQAGDLANIDSKTGLLNHGGLSEAFGATLNSYLHGGHRRSHDGLSIIMFDIDWFKQFNEERGHDYGDVVIRQVADASKAALRTDEGDILGRWGGDEFVSVLRTDSKSAFMAAERIRTNVDGLTECTVSAGVVNVDDFEHDRNVTTLEDFYRLGSKALRIAKKANPDKNTTYMLSPTEVIAE
jgi:diguanylate cyclase (GGDEF)-like protein